MDEQWMDGEESTVIVVVHLPVCCRLFWALRLQLLSTLATISTW